MALSLVEFFKKKINRPINAVIHASELDALDTEVEEYVLTDEVAKRMENFLEEYNNHQHMNGVWISGFFGSGKSHLLKMLALLLENKEISSGRVADKFLEKCEGNDFLQADIKKAASIPSKSILFNIDQKADTIDKSQRDALFTVFVKVFDEACGYYAKQAYIAQFERELDRDNLLEKFKEAFKSISNQDWNFGRERAMRFSKEIDKAYNTATGQNSENILDKFRSDYHLSIEDFANNVKEWLDKQPANYRINFFVDEVGQFIATNANFMVNLQTVAESLETKCKGRSWVIVTAQNDMGNVLNEMENKMSTDDYTKIQDRFKIRMNLTSANVSELVRLIPYCERNYNFIELGPKGTGKTHIYTDFSPHGTLISGSEVSAAKLFVNNSRKHDIGLVGYWDNIAFDEFAGKKKKIDDAFVDIMQNYMANKTFSRGTGKLSAEASMSFVGNTSHNVPYMLKNATLFDDIPPAYKKSAFLDRLWFYLPGWEVDITRGELFTKDYGFIVDYYSEALKSLRDYDYSNEYKNYFTLSSTLSERDRDGVTKTFSGLMKIIFPDKNATEDEIAEILKFAIEGRKRVKDQIMRIDTTFPDVDFEFENKSGETTKIKTTEELQYPNLYYGKSNDEYTDSHETIEIQEEQEETKIEDTTEPQKQAEEFKEKHFVIEENQCGVTYEKLFAPIFKSAKHIEIIDPYIRNFFQTLNLMELLEVIEKYKPETDVVQVDLITSVDEFNEQSQNENLETIRESCFQMGIEFSYKYDSTIHARSITTDNGWKVLLDRGLDIYQNCERKDAFQFTTRIQKFRPCKRFEITYLRNE